MAGEDEQLPNQDTSAASSPAVNQEYHEPTQQSKSTAELVRASLADVSSVEASSSKPSESGIEESLPSWTWGNWNSVLSSLQEVAVEAQKTASNAAMEVMHQLEVEVESSSSESAALVATEREPTVAIAEEMEKGLTGLDESVESLASGALQALGTAWQEGLQLIPSLNQSSDAQPHAPAGSGFANMVQFADPSALLKSGRDLASHGLQILEYVGRETAEAIAQETGIQLEDGAPPSSNPGGGEGGVGSGAEDSGHGQGEEEEEEESSQGDSFEHCLYIYGGAEHLEDLQALSDHHSLLCTRALSKLPPSDRASVEALLERLRAQTELAGLVPPPGAALSEERLLSGSQEEERRAVLASSLQIAQDLKSQVPSVLAGLSGAQTGRAAEEHLRTVRTEAVHRLSELTAISLACLLQSGRDWASASASSPAQGSASPPPTSLGEVGRREAAQAASHLRHLAEVLKGDLLSVTEAFCSGVHGVDQAPQCEEEGAAEEAAIAYLKAAVQATEKELQEFSSASAEKLQEGLRLLPIVLISEFVKAKSSLGQGAEQNVLT